MTHFSPGLRTPNPSHRPNPAFQRVGCAAHLTACDVCALCCVGRLLSSLAGHLDSDVAVEFYLRFTHALLLRHRNTLSASLHVYMQLLRRVGRVLARVRGEVGRLCEDNLYLLQVLTDMRRESAEGEKADGSEAAKVEEVIEGDTEAESGATVMAVENKVDGVTETDGKKSKKRRKAH